jgi:hypothetical protein
MISESLLGTLFGVEMCPIERYVQWLGKTFANLEIKEG